MSRNTRKKTNINLKKIKSTLFNGKEEVQKYFLTLAGTGKGGIGSSGGLGQAKGAFLPGAKRFVLITTQNGITSTLDATPVDIAKHKAKVTRERTGKPNGTSLTIFVPKTYIDSDGETRDIWMPYGRDSIPFLRKPLIGNAEIYWHRVYEPIEEPWNVPLEEGELIDDMRAS